MKWKEKYCGRGFESRQLHQKGIMTDYEKMEVVSDWVSKNQKLFKLDEYYGLEIISEIFRLVKMCSSDGAALGFDVVKSTEVDNSAK